MVQDAAAWGAITGTLSRLLLAQGVLWIAAQFVVQCVLTKEGELCRFTSAHPCKFACAVRHAICICDVWMFQCAYCCVLVPHHLWGAANKEH